MQQQLRRLGVCFAVVVSWGLVGSAVEAGDGELSIGITVSPSSSGGSAGVSGSDSGASGGRRPSYTQTGSGLVIGDFLANRLQPTVTVSGKTLSAERLGGAEATSAGTTAARGATSTAPGQEAGRRAAEAGGQGTGAAAPAATMPAGVGQETGGQSPLKPQVAAADAALAQAQTGTDPVHPGTGELEEQRIDLELPGVGLPWTWFRPEGFQRYAGVPRHDFFPPRRLLMSETWSTSVNELVRIFQQALTALIPSMEVAHIAWREGEAYDDWDNIAQALFSSVVGRSMALRNAELAFRRGGALLQELHIHI